MKTLKCPRCGEVFTVNENDYAEIANQVRNAEFHSAIEEHIEELKAQQDKDLQLALHKQQDDFNVQLNAKKQELADLQSRFDVVEQNKQSELMLAMSKKEQEILKLKADISNRESQIEMARLEEQQKNKEILQAKELEISSLKTSVETVKSEAANKEISLRDSYEKQLNSAQKEIDYYKDFKVRLSTKMIGESLEQHCAMQFEQMLRPLMPNAYFEKDNDISSGSKGDFIFRDYGADRTEYISIMFEMKNEADATATKHKNEDFLKKLDQDRKTKNCEFAVLVSMLEPDNELYNTGIVNVSHKYDRMYVIRPQFFLSLISLLVQTSQKTLEYKQELEIARRQSIDITNFETKLLDYQTRIGNNVDLAQKKYDEAINSIDKAIETLKKTKECLQGSANNLRLANKKAGELSIKRLTKDSPSLAEAFEQSKQ